ncbi:OadG family transporter subunit [Ruficoccus sp. ZRK36]|uniref:OadG family transporter subunit n=1 Tax=Ruficoccus sp. ZRK36 TaxID=2866311 RepID=UPI001C7398EA|nr:OadG family transporter subunit [Ruficoccus sp. ZRK36]QYY35751.1 OadG family protein [Ruficoccus sp. ZRK36]
MTFAATCSLASLLGEFEDSLHILLGFVFVIVVLAILAGVTQIVGLFFRMKKEAPKPAAAAAPAPAAASAAAPAGGVSPEVVAVIAAAVHTTLERPHRILSIRSASDRYWAAEGRREIFRSHKVR